MRVFATILLMLVAGHAAAQPAVGPLPVWASIPVSYTLDIQGEVFEVDALWDGRARIIADVQDSGELVNPRFWRGWRGVGSPVDFHAHVNDAHVHVKLYSFKGPGFERLDARTWVWNNRDDAFAAYKDYSDLQIATPLMIGNSLRVRPGIWEVNGVQGPRFAGATIFDQIVGGEQIKVDVIDFGYTEWPDIQVGFRSAIPEPSTLVLAVGALGTVLWRTVLWRRRR